MRPNITPLQDTCQNTTPVTPEQRQAEWNRIRPILAELMQIIRDQLMKEARQHEREAEGQ